MRIIKDKIMDIFFKAKAKKLCFLAAMLGYKYTTEWIKENVPEAALLIGEHLRIHPEDRNFMKYYIKSPEHIYEETLKKYRQSQLLEEHGFETEEIKMLIKESE